MEDKVKKQIQEKLGRYIEQIGSQNKAASSLQGVSPGTLSQIMNNKWDLISEEMWRNIGNQLDGDDDWNIVETANLVMFMQLLSEAKKTASVFGVTAPAGSSKTESIKQFIAAGNKNVYRLKCGDHWTKKYFCEQLLKVLGINGGGMTVVEMMDEIVRVLYQLEKPILIIDEFDKVADPILYFFITLFNELEDVVSIVVTATDYLEKRILKGVRNNRKGYREIYSRLGRKFIELPGVTYTDVTSICIANGIKDAKTIKGIFDDCDLDLRRVKRKIQATKAKQNAD